MEEKSAPTRGREPDTNVCGGTNEPIGQNKKRQSDKKRTTRGNAFSHFSLVQQQSYIPHTHCVKYATTMTMTTTTTGEYSNAFDRVFALQANTYRAPTSSDCYVMEYDRYCVNMQLLPEHRLQLLLCIQSMHKLR